MQESRTKNATRNAVAGVINRIVGLFIPFLLRTALIKVLGEQYLGLSSLFSSILQVLNLADLGFNTAIIYSMYKPIADGDDDTVCALLNLYRKIYLAIGFLILVAGLCVLPFLDKLINGGYPEGLNIYVLYLMYLVNTVSSYLFFAHRKSLLAAFQRSDIESNVSSIVQIIGDALKIVLLFLCKNYYLYILFVPLTTIAIGLITTIISYKMYPQYICRGCLSKDITKGILKRVSGLTIQKFGNTISTSLDSIIISSFLGLSALAIYSNYFYIVSSLMAFIWVCISSTTAGLGNSIAVDSIEKNYNNFKKLTLLNQWAISWTVPCLIVLYQHFMRIWVGPSLMEGTSLVVCMTVYFYVGEMRKVVLVFKDAAGIWWADKWKPLVGCIVNLIFNISLVQIIGMNGVIISTIVSYFFIEMPWETHVLFNRFFKKSEKKYYLDQVLFFLIAFMSSTICYFICKWLPETGVVFFIVKGIICFILSNLIFVGFFYKREEFKDILQMLTRKILKIKEKRLR